MSKLAAALVLVVLSLAACAGDKTLVANSAAAYVYFEDAYEQRCVEAVGPPTCAQYQAVLVQAKRQTQLANKVYVIGKLPKAERAQLEDLVKRLEALP